MVGYFDTGPKEVIKEKSKIQQFSSGGAIIRPRLWVLIVLIIVKGHVTAAMVRGSWAPKVRCRRRLVDKSCRMRAILRRVPHKLVLTVAAETDSHTGRRQWRD